MHQHLVLHPPLDGLLVGDQAEIIVQLAEIADRGAELSRDAKTIDKLAKMPSREVLLARLVGSMNATIGNFVRVVEAIRKQKAGEE